MKNETKQLINTFIETYNVAYEDKEQQQEIAVAMQWDINNIIDSIKVCKGCGHRSDVEIGETYLACCPDSSYVSLDEYLKKSVYK